MVLPVRVERLMPTRAEMKFRARMTPAVVRRGPQTPPSTRVELTLPLPPSKNNLTKRAGAEGGGYRDYPTEAKEKFIDSVKKLGAKHRCRPIDGPVFATLRVFADDGDLHNREELLFDALEGVAYANDKQVVGHLTNLFPAEGNPRVEVLFTKKEAS